MDTTKFTKAIPTKYYLLQLDCKVNRLRDIINLIIRTLHLSRLLCLSKRPLYRALSAIFKMSKYKRIIRVGLAKAVSSTPMMKS